MSEAIKEFFGKYRFLSNFYPVRVVYEGIEYPSVEHAYQAAKSTRVSVKISISKLGTAGQAKRMGKKLKIRGDWDQVKLGIMSRLVHLKFANPALRNLLLLTGDRELIEGNYWGDRFWGVCNGEGANNLGLIIMNERRRIKGLEEF